MKKRKYTRRAKEEQLQPDQKVERLEKELVEANEQAKRYEDELVVKVQQLEHANKLLNEHRDMIDRQYHIIAGLKEPNNALERKIEQYKDTCTLLTRIIKVLLPPED